MTTSTDEAILQELHSKLHAERRYLTAKTIAIEHSLPRRTAISLLERLPYYDTKREFTYEITRCIMDQVDGKYVAKLQTNLETIREGDKKPDHDGGDGTNTNANTQIYSVTLQVPSNATSMLLAHEETMCLLKDHQDDMLVPDLSCDVIEPEAGIGTLRKISRDDARQHLRIQPRDGGGNKGTGASKNTSKGTGTGIGGNKKSTIPTIQSKKKNSAPKKKATTAAAFFKTEKTVKNNNKSNKASSLKKSVPKKDKKDDDFVGDVDSDADSDAKVEAEVDEDSEKKTEGKKKSSSSKNNKKKQQKKKPVSKSKTEKHLKTGNADDFVGDVDEDDEFLKEEEERKKRNAAHAEQENIKRKRKEKQMENQPRRMVPKRKTIEDDDDDDDDNDDQGMDERQDKEEVEEEKVGAMDAFASKRIKTTTSLSSQGNSQQNGGKTRKKRVLEDRTFVDEKGFLRTETVSVWKDVEEPEKSVSNSASASKSQKPGKVVAKSKPKSSKNMKQQGLMGFFSKKK